MTDYRDQKDKEILALLPIDGDKALEMMFSKYYTYICKALIRVINNERTTEDLAQEVFLDVWRKREDLNITISLKAYLRRAAINKALNYIRDKKINWTDDEATLLLESNLTTVHQSIEAEELQAVIDNSIDNLPERCRLVFSLSRFEGMAYKEIADQLGISVRTVENQISKALKLLRISLKEYL